MLALFADQVPVSCLLAGVTVAVVVAVVVAVAVAVVVVTVVALLS